MKLSSTSVRNAAGRVAIGGVLMFLFAPQSALAVTWTGVTNADWFTGSNWSGGVPTSSVGVTINLTPGPTIGSSGATGADINIGTTGGGALTISGGTLSDTDTFLGTGANGNGTLTINNGGALATTINEYIGATTNGSGTINLTGTGSSITANSEIIVGLNGGVGALSVQQGAVANGTVGIEIGGDAHSQGTVTVGTGGSMTTVGQTHIGAYGAGTLNISGGGTVFSTSYNIVATFSGSSGMLTIDGVGSQLNSSTSLSVGRDGAASMVISNGGVDNNVTGYLGEFADSVAGYRATGQALITGSTSAWHNNSDLYIGFQGTGALTIANGATVSTASGTSYVSDFNNATKISTATTYIATTAGSVGTLNIGAPPGSAAVAPGTLVTNVVAFGSGMGAINFNHTSSNYVFAPDITGNGTLNMLAGNTFLTGNLSGFTGAVDVSPGASVTSKTAQQASVQDLANRQQSMMIANRAAMNKLLGMTRPVDSTTYLYSGYMVGSSLGYAGGQIAGKKFTFVGGIAYGSQDTAGIQQSNAPTVAAAIRYSFNDPFGDARKAYRPYAEIGGSVTPQETLTQSRDYASGANILNGNANTLGQGNSNAIGWYEYGRLGLAWNPDTNNKIVGWGEVGQQNLNFDGYTESGANNPFMATVGSGQTNFGVTRLGMSYTRDLSSLIYAPWLLTVAGAAAHSFDVHSGLNAMVDTVSFTPSGAPVTWGEFGAQLNMRFSSHLSAFIGLDGTTEGIGGTLLHGSIGLASQF